MKIFTTEQIEEIINNYHKGYPITRSNRIFYQNHEGTLSSDIIIAYTNEEKLEYAKCSNDIQYFIENYCGIILREYQKDWIKNFNDNRFLIYCTSRQSGYSTIMAAVYLHYLIFNIDKNIYLLANKSQTSVEFIKKVYNHYLKIPYFLKPGIVSKNIKNIKFNNRNRIASHTASKTPSIGYTIDIFSFLEFAHIPPNILEPYYITIVPTISAMRNSRLIIQSTPNGNNLFIELLHNSERKINDPLKNTYKPIRTYWWEVPDRDEEWKQQEIKKLGSEELFNQEYDLRFITTRKTN